MDSPTTEAGAGKTPFQRAWEEYVAHLPPKKKQRRFLMNCARAIQENSDSSPASAVNEAIITAEKKHSMQASRRIIRKYVDPVIAVLNDFDAIISNLVSADPMPTAIIWGALKVIIDGLSRFSNLFETIKNELRSLRDHLELITDHENLYGKDEKMQNLLCRSYVNIIRFWHRVDKECDNCGFALLKTVASFSTKKLESILADMQHDAQEIGKRAGTLQAIELRGEHEEAAIARREAADEMRRAEEERRDQRLFREERRREAPNERFNNLCSKLSSLDTNAPNFLRRDKFLKNHIPGTCQWLLEHPDFVAWTGEASPPVLWLHGPPGSGKSTLCSTVSSRLDTVAFHFCDFAQQYKPYEILRMLALQLLCKYWTDMHDVPPELCDVAQSSPSVLANVQNIIRVLIKNQERVYFLLDGLDEETTGERWRDIADVLHFLIQLTNDFPSKVRLWCSSQPRTLIKRELDGYPTIDISIHVKQDIAFFLSKAIPEAEELEPLDQERFLRSLHQRAECSFLWASLMISELQNSPTSLREMKQFVDRGLPSTLLDYYTLFFKRLKKTLRPLACKLFALIVFARRPLRFSELQEAIWCLKSNSTGYLNPEDKPFLKQLHEVAQPLIEMTKVEGPQIGDAQEDYTCRLFHSTLRDFLVEHPDVLVEVGDPGSDLRISADIAMDACLVYLCQTKYAKLLTRENGRWVDAVGNPVENQHFLVYAAKYWDKHLDDISELHKKDVLQRLNSFITSSNFQTCIQVQSLWVELQFCVFRVTTSDERCRFLRRVFPSWFSRETEIGIKLWRNYRCFLHEWKYFLACGNCHRANPRCAILPYMGQLDRIWFGALGQSNFLSRLNSQYSSFVFQVDQDDGLESSLGRFFDGIGEDGSVIMTLRARKSQGDSLQFVCDTWSLSSRQLPVRKRTQEIQLSSELCGWPLYVGKTIHLPLQTGKAAPAAFSSDCKTLRIGTQLFAIDTAGDFVSLPQVALHTQKSSYVEEFCRRGKHVVIASRTRMRTKDLSVEDSEPVAPMDTSHTPSSGGSTAVDDEGSDSDSESSDGRSSTTSESESDAEESDDDGYESWSDSSTVFSEDFVFDDDMITPWADHFRDMDSDSSDTDTSDTDVASDHEDDIEVSDSDQGEVPGSAFGYGKARNEDGDDWDVAYFSDEDGNQIFVPKHTGRSSPGESQATLAIFDTGAFPHTKLFCLTRPIRCKVYDSPPAIHPTVPLVVWPLGGGDVLFVDFLDKTYFVRKLRASTSHTRHIFMKCRFSACGRFLHIAALEGQQPVQKKGTQNRQGLDIAVLVSTYRLSSRKTSRSPPTLIHRVRVKLGNKESLSVTKLPYTVTWAANELYISCSDRLLRVHRVPLFKSAIEDQEDEDAVLVPRKPIFLPETAMNRQVHYFPSRNEGSDEASNAHVLIGSEIRKKESQPLEHDVEFSTIGRTFVGLQGEFSPPIGCYLDDESDLGGWGKSYDSTEIPGQLGIGCLDRRLEKFDFDDDCDLEPYIY
ncbi:uncharacterized protein FIBRA_05105 [Fibroporia radiculosa]|uniref:Uncharacterized protein n=1 Tax=Fibroporia radiculosa TaxID=599839 RepID=J4GQE4_9APHY|nr:uncharacterized protein FIBRA_05105 [Fibroporia radiculosa]CCM02990.1 predicted protein [Fibroporia radiculosa]